MMYIREKRNKEKIPKKELQAKYKEGLGEKRKKKKSFKRHKRLKSRSTFEESASNSMELRDSFS